MKKLILSLVAGGMFFAVNAHAGFGLPSTGSVGGDIAVKAGKTAVNKGIEKSINDKIAKQNCAFKDAKTKNQTTCDLNAIIKDLKGWRDGLENTIADNVEVDITASAADSNLAWDRVSFVQDKLRAGLSSWRWDTHKVTDNGDKLKIQVTVK